MDICDLKIWNVLIRVDVCGETQLFIPFCGRSFRESDSGKEYL